MQNNPTSIDPLMGIAIVLAHSAVYFGTPVQDIHLYAMDDDGPTPTSESTREMLRSYAEEMPNLMRAISGNILPIEQALQDTSRVISPQSNQLDLDIYRQYAPQFSEVGRQIAAQEQQGQVADDSALLASPEAQRLLQQSVAAQRVADPEYYRQRENASAALDTLFGSLTDPNAGLSAAERREVSQSLARDNNDRGNESPTAMSTVENAMQYGAAGNARQQQRQAAISDAVGSATGFLPASQSRVDAFQQVTGRPSMNFGGTQFQGADRNVGDQAMDVSRDFLGDMGQFQRQRVDLQANKRDAADRWAQGFSSAAPCCWIFLAATGGELPWFVRYCRDHLGTNETRRGYRRMAQWLVPLMQRSSVIRTAVDALIVHPITQYGGYLVREPGYESGFVFRNVKRFWFAVWNKLGNN